MTESHDQQSLEKSMDKDLDSSSEMPSEKLSIPQQARPIIDSQPRTDQRGLLTQIAPEVKWILQPLSQEQLAAFIKQSVEVFRELQTNIESNRHKGEENRYRLTIFGICAIVTVIVCCLIYAKQTGDQTLPDKLFAYFLGISGGTGILALFNRRGSQS